MCPPLSDFGDDVGDLPVEFAQRRASVHIILAVTVSGNAQFRGKPRIRSAMMFRWISDVPPAMVAAKVRK